MAGHGLFGGPKEKAAIPANAYQHRRALDQVALRERGGGGMRRAGLGGGAAKGVCTMPLCRENITGHAWRALINRYLQPQPPSHSALGARFGFSVQPKPLRFGIQRAVPLPPLVIRTPGAQRPPWPGCVRGRRCWCVQMRFVCDGIRRYLWGRAHGARTARVRCARPPFESAAVVQCAPTRRLRFVRLPLSHLSAWGSRRLYGARVLLCSSGGIK